MSYSRFSWRRRKKVDHASSGRRGGRRRRTVPTVVVAIADGRSFSSFFSNFQKGGTMLRGDYKHRL